MCGYIGVFGTRISTLCTWYWIHKKRNSLSEQANLLGKIPDFLSLASTEKIFQFFRNFHFGFIQFFIKMLEFTTFLDEESNEYCILFTERDVTRKHVKSAPSNFEFMKISTFFFYWHVWRGILNVNFVNKKGAKSWVKCH